MQVKNIAECPKVLFAKTKINLQRIKCHLFCFENYNRESLNVYNGPYRRYYMSFMEFHWSGYGLNPKRVLFIVRMFMKQ